MDIDDRAGMKALARDSLARASYNPQKMLMIHTGATLILSLLVLVANELLNQQMNHAGGLSGMGTRAILGTIQSVLQFGQLVALPFWQMGYLYVTIRIARRQVYDLQDLFEGFRCFGPVLRLTLLQTLLFAGLAVLGSNIGSVIFLFTPWAKPMLEAILPSMMGNNTLSEEAFLAATEAVQVPLVITMAICFLALAAPFVYRYRMAQFYLMENPQKGALAALRHSTEMTKYLRFSLFRLDLSFWYFYVLDLLVSVLVYVDVILSALGIAMPWSATTMYYIAFFLYAGGQLALYWWKRNLVGVTLAHMYMLLNDTEEPEPPKKTWNY